MKSFWGSFLGTLVGVFVAFLFILFLVVGIIYSSVTQLSKQADRSISIKQNSVLHVKFDDEIPERSSNNPIGNFSFGDGLQQPPLGLNQILANIEKAKNDKNIKGIYLDIASIPAGIATLEEIRTALLDFKTSGKFLVSYSEGYTQGAYYLATAADKIYLNPQGMVEFKGLSRQIQFYKNLLGKLDVEMQIFRHGKFKSATEPLFLDKMSKENRDQTSAYINSIWDYILGGISQERHIAVDELNRYADNMLITDGESALNYKLVDQLVYKDEMLDILKDLSDAKSADKINYVEMHKYVKAAETRIIPASKNKIAIVYASGSIEGGEGDDKTIGSENISKAIREARLDDNVKAIVLRVNSPGGSALASDIIWREMVLAKKAKPVVVSMGDVAASGGYYIACAADAIVAHPNTVTGSIGVFGVFPNMKNLFEDKLGITVDTVKTNKHSDIFSPYRPIGKEEGEVIQKWIENTYTDFITKVGKGRNMSAAEVDSIGQGRVWSGIDAKKIGLVDAFGGIKDAIALAAEKAKLQQYNIIELPKQKEPFEEFFGNIFNQDAMVEGKLKDEFGTTYENYRNLKNVMKYKGVQMRMLYDEVIY